MPFSLGVSPLKGFSLFVVAADVADEFAIEIFNRDEDAASDYVTLFEPWPQQRSRSGLGLDSPAFFSPVAKSRYVQTPPLSCERIIC